mgnify:FL=1
MLIDDIKAKCPEALASKDPQVIADAFNVGRVRVVTKLGGIGTVLETLGPINGAAVLDNLEAMAATNSAVKWAFVLINRGELDFGSSATRSMMDLLLPAEVAAALKSIAEVPDPITELDVRKTLWDESGEWLGG